MEAGGRRRSRSTPQSVYWLSPFFFDFNVMGWALEGWMRMYYNIFRVIVGVVAEKSSTSWVGGWERMQKKEINFSLTNSHDRFFLLVVITSSLSLPAMPSIIDGRQGSSMQWLWRLMAVWPHWGAEYLLQLLLSNNVLSSDNVIIRDWQTTTTTTTTPNARQRKDRLIAHDMYLL